MAVSGNHSSKDIHKLWKICCGLNVVVVVGVVVVDVVVVDVVVVVVVFRAEIVALSCCMACVVLVVVVVDVGIVVDDTLQITSSLRTSGYDKKKKNLFEHLLYNYVSIISSVIIKASLFFIGK